MYVFNWYNPTLYSNEKKKSNFSTRVLYNFPEIHSISEFFVTKKRVQRIEKYSEIDIYLITLL